MEPRWSRDRSAGKRDAVRLYASRAHLAHRRRRRQREPLRARPQEPAGAGAPPRRPPRRVRLRPERPADREARRLGDSPPEACLWRQRAPFRAPARLGRGVSVCLRRGRPRDPRLHAGHRGRARARSPRAARPRRARRRRRPPSLRQHRAPRDDVPQSLHGDLPAHGGRRAGDRSAGGGEQRLQRGEHESLLATLGNGTRALSVHDHDGRCLGRAVWRRRGARPRSGRSSILILPKGSSTRSPTTLAA